MSEYAQKSAKKVDLHIYPSGKKVIKAFTADNFVFYEKAGHTLQLINDSSLAQAQRVRITWRIQKNRCNGQKITLPAEKSCITICAVCAAGLMFSAQDGWANRMTCQWRVTLTKAPSCT